MDDRALDELLDSLTPRRAPDRLDRAVFDALEETESLDVDGFDANLDKPESGTNDAASTIMPWETNSPRKAVPLRKKGPAIAAALAAAAVLLILAWPRAETPDTGDMALLAEGEAPEPLPEEALEARALLLKLKLSRLRKLASATPKCERYRTDLYLLEQELDLMDRPFPASSSTGRGGGRTETFKQGEKPDDEDTRLDAPYPVVPDPYLEPGRSLDRSGRGLRAG